MPTETHSSHIECPPLPATECYVDIQILDGGSFTANERRVLAGGRDREFTVPDWAFLIRDAQTGRQLLWDYGLSEHTEEFTPFVQNNLFRELRPRSPPKSVAQQISEHNTTTAAELETIIFSHAHWDHCRPFWNDFSRAKAFFGPGTFAHCQPGHLKDPASQWDGRIFDESEGFNRCHELDGPWIPFGPFARAMDFFGNGSFWVIQAPGHMAGNVIAAARLMTGTWVIMAGDCCHARQIYEGLDDFAIFTLPGGHKACLQEDVPAAKDTLARIKAFEDHYSAKVCLAHDATWLQQGSEDPLLCSLTSPSVRQSFHSSLSPEA